MFSAEAEGVGWAGARCLWLWTGGLDAYMLCGMGVLLGHDFARRKSALQYPCTTLRSRFSVIGPRRVITTQVRYVARANCKKCTGRCLSIAFDNVYKVLKLNIGVAYTPP